ncbi:MAG TPA: hypothetical protein VFV49_04460 [Thermoanaerobaculia bacterium]|nr:hypothetical protein [Thermoanaerobaculia bacterium]
MVLLYQVLSSLQIAMLYGPTLLVIGVTLAIAAVAGLLAAIGGSVVRVVVLTACALMFLDVTFHLSGLFDHLRPEGRGRRTRDQKRVADIQQIKAALDRYVAQVGPLPTPRQYGEASGPAGFWQGSWDLSTHEGNQNDAPFLEFLADAGILPVVPVDPVNQAAKAEDPRGGQQYVFYIVPPGIDYAGGTCDARPNRWHYLVAITDLEDENSRPPKNVKGSGCDCLWRNDPNFFQKRFDYVLCGTFDATPESRARAEQARLKTAAAARLAKNEAAGRPYVSADQRRVSDITQIQQALQRYIKEIGPLPLPRDYGEADIRSKPGFWEGYWDLSSEDGNGDGRKFLDFLVEGGMMPAVPVDPDNEPAADGSVTRGRQYAYLVIPPKDKYQGGSCGAPKNQWVYLLGITDLRSEFTRPPTKIAGSGCECLWQKQPNFFQKHFDYVVCGTFDSTPESRARVAQIRAKQAAEALVRKRAAAARVFGARDQRRVADLLRIKQALQTYITKVGPLPKPSEYGEGESPGKPGFWQSYWDLSSEDGDRDGKPFLDFLVEKRIMASVPVDPENKRAADGDPKGGRQYVYFVAPATEKYSGGTCGASKKQWVYMLAITDLQSELTRPPLNIKGSGCECLWRDQPNYFQAHFDYVTCGTFSR